MRGLICPQKYQSGGGLLLDGLFFSVLSNRGFEGLFYEVYKIIIFYVFIALWIFAMQGGFNILSLFQIAPRLLNQRCFNLISNM